MGAHPRPRASTEAVLVEHLGVEEHPLLVVGAAVAAVAAVAIALGCYVKREKIKPVFCGSTGPVYSKLGVEMGELGGADSDVDDGDDELILN